MLMVGEQPVEFDDGNLYDAGGAPLTDHAAERQLLGFLINRPSSIAETIDIVSPTDLHDPIHRRIYELLIRSYETDVIITAQALIAGLGGEKVSGQTIARMVAETDLDFDVSAVADHISIIAERRAVGTVDDVDFHRGAPFVSKFGAMAWEDIATDGAPAYAWLVEDVLPLGEIAMAFGESGTGKSFMMFDMALCIARGIKFFGHNVEPGLVIYVAAEAGKGFGKRKIAYAMQHKLEPSEPLPFVLLTKRPNFFQSDGDVSALLDEITQIIRRYTQRLVCVVLDTYSAITQGMDEISGKDQALVRRRLMMLQEKFNTTVVVVHHKPKNGSSPRGHGSITADIETTIEFQTVVDKKTDTGKVIHRAIAQKQREGKSGISWEFTLPVIDVGTNKWGNADTSCVVQPYNSGGQKAPAVGFHATPTEMLFMRALYDALLDHPAPPPAGLPKSIAHVVEQQYVRALMKDRTIAPHEDGEVANGRFRTAFSRAGAKLRDGGVIGVQGALLWPTGKAVQGFSTTGG